MFRPLLHRAPACRPAAAAAAMARPTCAAFVGAFTGQRRAASNAAGGAQTGPGAPKTLVIAGATTGALLGAVGAAAIASGEEQAAGKSGEVGPSGEGAASTAASTAALAAQDQASGSGSGAEGAKREMDAQHLQMLARSEESDCDLPLVQNLAAPDQGKDCLNERCCLVVPVLWHIGGDVWVQQLLRSGWCARGVSSSSHSVTAPASQERAQSPLTESSFWKDGSAECAATQCAGQIRKRALRSSTRGVRFGHRAREAHGRR